MAKTRHHLSFQNKFDRRLTQYPQERNYSETIFVSPQVGYNLSQRALGLELPPKKRSRDLKTHQSQSDKLLPSEWRLLVLLAAIQFTNNVDFMIMMPLGPKLMRIFDIGPQSFSWLVSAYTFAGAVSGILASLFLDRFDRKKALQLTYTFFIIGNLGCALSTSYFWLLSFRIFAGLFGGILSAQILSIVGDNIPASRRGRGMAIIMAAFSVASVFGIPFSLWLADIFDWHGPFYFLSIFSGILWLGIQFEVPAQRSHLSTHPSKDKAATHFLQILKSPNVPRALLLVPFVMLGFFTIIPMLNPFLVANVHVPENQIFLMYLLGGFATMFTAPLVGTMVDRLGAFKIYTIVTFLMAPLFIAITHLGPSPMWYVYLHTTTLFIFGNGRMISSMSIITGVVPPQVRGGFMSLVSASQQIASGLAAFVGGVLVSRDANGIISGYQRSGYLSIVAGFVAIYIARTLPSGKRHKASASDPMAEAH